MKKTILNRNENHYGPAPACIQTLRNLKRDKMNLYLEGAYVSLLTKFLAKKYKIEEAQIIASYGGEDFLRFVYNRLRPEKDSILAPEYSYSYYKSYASHLQIPIHLFKMHEKSKEFTYDLKDCIEKCKALGPSILILASPNNPTGNSISFEDLEMVMITVSHNTLVILDEVYWGFDSHYKEPNYKLLLEKYPNLVILRSFSKRYALAGLRIGFALCGSKSMDLLKYQRPYVGLSRVVEEAAIAALQSESYYNKVSNQIQKDRDWLIKQAADLRNFKFYSSKANFISFKVNSKVLDNLRGRLNREKRIFWKELDNGFWRVTIGLTRDVKRFYSIIKKVDVGTK